MNRREFGKRALRIAASLGMTTVSLGALAGCDETIPGSDAGADASLPNARPGTSVVIIGSGYGSAVTAARLVAKGIPVTMLEAGRLWDTPGSDGKIFCKPFQPDERAMWFQDRTEAVVSKYLGIGTEMDVDVAAGVLGAAGPAHMRAYQGRGVGGGSLVNMALYLEPPREIVERVLPTVDTDEFFDVYLRRAAGVLRAGEVSQRLLDSEFYRYSRVGIELSELAGFPIQKLRSGYDFDYMELELDRKVPRSALAGEAGFGNNHGKRSLDKTYLADAMGTGLLTLHALHVVRRFVRDPAGGYVVEVDAIDVSGNVLERKEFPSTHLFVGAGSIPTSELFVRARERGDLPDLNAAVGTKWGPNGDLFVGLDNPLRRPTGTGQQATIPTHAFVTRDERGRRMVAEFVPFPVGIPSVQSFVIVIADNPEAGHFTYDAATDRVDLRWDRAQNEPSVSAARFAFDRVNARAGSEYTSTMEFKDGSQFGDQVTYHPMGGMPLGEATDDYGRIREYPGLYVVDGSLIPVGIGANPSLSITALAERNIERILATDLAI